LSSEHEAARTKSRWIAPSIIIVVVLLGALAVGGYALFRENQRLERIQSQLSAQATEIQAQSIVLQVIAKPDPRVGQVQLDVTQLRSEIDDVESCLASIGIQPAFSASWDTFGVTC